MGKSILVVDTSETCLNCKFCREIYEGIEACCEICDEPDDKELCRMIDVDYFQEKPDWCPICDLPEKLDENIEDCEEGYYIGGWNDCIDKILEGGDTE